MVVSHFDVFSYKLSWCWVKLKFFESCCILDTANEKAWEIYYVNPYPANVDNLVSSYQC